MTRISLLGGVAAMGAMLTTPLAAAGNPQIDAAIRRHIEAHDISGAVVLVDKRGAQTIDVEGNSTMEGGAPLHADSVVWLASMTKPVVAVSLMIMVEAGKVKLDDPVSKYIPEFSRQPTVRTALGPIHTASPTAPPDPNAPKTPYSLAPAKRALLVRDFVTMTAGLQTIGIPNETWPQITPNDTLATWTPKLAATTLDFEPGTRWAYSNQTEFEVVARIVEVASGMPYAKFVQQRIFDPLGMRDSTFGTRSDLADRTLPLGGLANNPIMMGKFSSGSAGMLSTAHDYGQFAAMLRNGGTLNGHRILKPATVKMMSSNQIGGVGLAGIDPSEYVGLDKKPWPGLKYGYGFAVVTDGPASKLTLPTGSFGWDGVGTRRMWVIPATGTTIVMIVPAAAPGGAARFHREVEAIVNSGGKSGAAQP